MKRAKVLVRTAAWVVLVGVLIARASAQPIPKAEDYNLPAEDRAKPAMANPPANDIAPPLATPAEIDQRRGTATAPAWVFVEPRERPIRRFDGLPQVWLDRVGDAQPLEFRGTARPGEFFVFQIAVYAAGQDVGPLALESADLRGDAGTIAAVSARCLNLGGIDPHGRPFKKQLSVPQGRLQPLWVGIEIPRDAKGSYQGTFGLTTGTSTPTPVRVTLDVGGEPLDDAGDAQPQNLSRLRWLDSTAGSEPSVTRPFTDVRVDNRDVLVLGRRLRVADSGLPAQLTSYFSASNTHITATGRELLSGPIEFIIEAGGGPLQPRTQLAPLAGRTTDATWSAANSAGPITWNVSAVAGYDGIVSYQLRLTAATAQDLRDIRLEIPLRRDVAKYLMGLGRRGGLRGADLHWKWDVARLQDAVWIGDVNAGLACRFKGSNYRRPLVNIYYPFGPLALPDSWGTGGVDVVEDAAGDRVVLRAFTGPRHLDAGQTLDFNFELYLTPFKPIDTEAQWSTRYVHPKEHADQAAMDKVFTLLGPGGPNVVNIHQATPFEPYINYPYHARSVADLKDYVSRLHERQIRAKIYYTTREITNHMPELWTLLSLGGEVIFPGPGKDAKTVVNKNGPDPWLVEHLRENFIPAWRTRVPPPYDDMDLSVITTPDSRWNNFYLQGLKWLCDNVDLDGIYVDDTALDRTSLQRARRILDTRQGRLIDLHSWNHLKPLGSFANSAILYLELFPYVDRLWFGEGFNYNDTLPDFWLVEISGIPFGNLSEMLQGGGNRWLGMLYGMTMRLLWSGDPRPVWKLWDDFGMAGSQMIGYWDPACPVRTGNPNVLATVYRQKGRALVALGNFSDKPEKVTLQVDRDALGLPAPASELHAPAIENFQTEARFGLSQEIPLEPKRGLLLILRDPDGR